MMASTATQATYCGVMSILWEFQASHKLGPSRSITCKGNAMSDKASHDSAWHESTPQVIQLCFGTPQCVMSDWAYHDVEVPLLAFVVHFWQPIYISQVPAAHKGCKNERTVITTVLPVSSECNKSV